jgi:hypothetical protein
MQGTDKNVLMLELVRVRQQQQVGVGGRVQFGVRQEQKKAGESAGCG